MKLRSIRLDKMKYSASSDSYGVYGVQDAGEMRLC